MQLSLSAYSDDDTQKVFDNFLFLGKRINNTFELPCDFRLDIDFSGAEIEGTIFCIQHIKSPYSIALITVLY